MNNNSNNNAAFVPPLPSTSFAASFAAAEMMAGSSTSSFNPNQLENGAYRFSSEDGSIVQRPKFTPITAIRSIESFFIVPPEFLVVYVTQFEEMMSLIHVRRNAAKLDQLHDLLGKKCKDRDVCKRACKLIIESSDNKLRAARPFIDDFAEMCERHIVIYKKMINECIYALRGLLDKIKDHATGNGRCHEVLKRHAPDEAEAMGNAFRVQRIFVERLQHLLAGDVWSEFNQTNRDSLQEFLATIKIHINKDSSKRKGSDASESSEPPAKVARNGGVYLSQATSLPSASSSPESMNTSDIAANAAASSTESSLKEIKETSEAMPLPPPTSMATNNNISHDLPSQGLIMPSPQ